MNLVLLLLLVTSVVTTFSAHIPVKGGRHRPDVTRPIEDKSITQTEKKEDAAISSDLNLELSKSSSVEEAALGINESTLKGQQSTLSEERTLKDVTISADGQLERDVKKESSQSTNTHEENHHSTTLNGEKHLFKKTIENQNQDKVVVREQTSSLGDASFTSPKQVKLEDEHKILITDEKNTHKILEDTLNDKKINQEETSHLIHDSHAHHSFPDNIHHAKHKTVIVHDVIDHEKDSNQRHEININTQGSDDKQKKVIINDFRGLNLDKQETQNEGISTPTAIPAFGENYDGINEKRENAQISTSAPFPKDGGALKVDEIDQKNFEEKIFQVDQKKVDEKSDEVLEKKLDEKVKGSLEVATGSKVHNIHHDQKILSELDIHKKDESHHQQHPHHEYSWKGHHEHDFRPEHDQKHLEVDVHKKDESHHEHHSEGHHGHDFHPGHDQKHLEVDIHKKDESHHEHHLEDHHGHDFHPGHDQKHLEVDVHKKDESHHEHHLEGHHGHDFHPGHDQKHLEVDVHKKDESHHEHHLEGHHGHDFHPGHDQKHLGFDAHQKHESHHHFDHEHHPYHGHHSEHHHDHDFHLGKDQKHLEGGAHKKDESHHEHDSYHGHHWEGPHGHVHPEHDQKHLEVDVHKKDESHHGHHWDGHHGHDFHPGHDQKHLEDDAHHPYHRHHWEHHHDHDFHLGKDQKHLEGDMHQKDEPHYEHDSYHGHHWEGHHGHDHPEHDQKHFDHEHHPYHEHHWEHHHDHDFHPKHHHESPSHKFVPKDLPKPVPPVVEEKEVIKTDDTRVIEEESGDKKETVFELETNTGSVKSEEEEKEVKLEVASVGKEEAAAEGSAVVGAPAILKDIDVHHHVPEHDIHHEHHHHHCDEEKFHHVPHHHDHVPKPVIVKDEGVSKIDIAEEKLDKKIESVFKLSSEEEASAESIGIPPDVPKKDIHDHHHVKHNPVKGGRPYIPHPHEHDYHDYYDYSGEHYPHEEKYHHHSHYDDYHEDRGSPYHSQWTEI